MSCTCPCFTIDLSTFLHTVTAAGTKLAAAASTAAHYTTILTTQAHAHALSASLAISAPTGSFSTACPDKSNSRRGIQQRCFLSAAEPLNQPYNKSHRPPVIVCHQADCQPLQSSTSSAAHPVKVRFQVTRRIIVQHNLEQRGTRQHITVTLLECLCPHTNGSRSV